MVTRKRAKNYSFMLSNVNIFHSELLKFDDTVSLAKPKEVKTAKRNVYEINAFKPFREQIKLIK